MSTLGKVLVVLVTLMLLVWIFLASLVAEHNAQWSKRVADLKAQVESTAAQIPPLVAEADKARAEAELQQVALDRIRRNARGEMFSRQKTESDVKETLARLDLELKLAESQVKAAMAIYDRRLREKNDLIADIDREKAGVEALKAENTALRTELATLTKNYLSTVAENQSLLSRISKAPARSEGPTTRLGSLKR